MGRGQGSEGVMEDQGEDEEEEGIVVKTPLLCCVILCMCLLGNVLSI